MKLDYVIHHGENGSSSCSSLEINSFEELNKIRFGKYWKNFFGNKERS